MITDIIDNITWEDFISLTESNDSTSSDYIYRGQSNSFNFPNNFTEWDIISSFNRTYSVKNFRFREFLSQQLEERLFKITYGKYEFVRRTNLDKSDLITRLYFLQHYGIPTCLLDFSFNPLVALYFSLTSLKGHKFRSCNSDGIPTIYPEECKISIIQINHRLLKEKIKVKEINHKNNDLFLEYEKYGMDLSKEEWCYLGIDLYPYLRINSEIDNYNLKAQDGCFILFDNVYAHRHDLISFLERYCLANNITLSEPIVRIYKINYNNLYKPMRSKRNEYKPVFKYTTSASLLA